MECDGGVGTSYSLSSSYLKSFGSGYAAACPSTTRKQGSLNLP